LSLSLAVVMVWFLEEPVDRLRQKFASRQKNAIALIPTRVTVG
jgi:hypothetical protein